MGTPIPSPDPEYGNDCTLCTPARWPSGQTPKFIYAFFTGIVDCGISPHPFGMPLTLKMEQSAVNNCIWVHTGDVWLADYQPDLIVPDKSRLRLQDHHGFSHFTSDGNSCPPEYSTYANAQAACILAYAGSAGTGTIFWSEEILFLIEELGLDAGPNLFYDYFNVDTSDRVHKFADQQQRTNLKLLLEP